MNEKRRGLGKGLGALIPGGPAGATGSPAARGDRPVDVFFAERPAASRERPPTDETENRGQSTATPVDVWRPTKDAVDDTPTKDVSAGAAPTPPTAPTAEAEISAEDTAVIEHDDVSSAPDGDTPAADADTSETGGTPETGDIPETGDTPETAGTPPTTEAPVGAPDDEVEAGASQTELVPVPGARFAEIPVDQISPNPRQPRQVFDEDALAELVHSIGEVGVLQPIVVRPLADDRYELVMGERRWRATQQAGLAAIPAIIRETDDDDLLRDALLENLHRSELNPLEEAAAYQQLLEDFGCTHEELAGRIGRSRPQITNTIRLLRLPALVQRRVAAGVLSAGHARALLGLGDGASIERLAQRIVAEGMSVRATEEAVAVGERSPSASRPAPRAGGRSPALEGLATRLSDQLDTRVTIALGRKKGKMTVEFASVEDLERILATLAPGHDVSGVRREVESGADENGSQEE